MAHIQVGSSLTVGSFQTPPMCGSGLGAVQETNHLKTTYLYTVQSLDVKGFWCQIQGLRVESSALD